jgi:glycosyltransferase involved in cell wall biosynthesis
MHIVMYASGIPFNGDTIKEKSLGGSETAAYEVAKELSRRGHKVIMFTDTAEAGEFDGVNYIPIGPRTEAKPMGQNWHFYCENTPHDINIVQRVPHGFAWHIQSKINLWWAHDIALKRNSDPFMAQTWQTNRVMPVSNWFKEQIVEAWNANPEIVTPIHNGVDYSMFEEYELKDNSQGDENRTITMIYSSRPERGLDNLVAPGGIMEQLLEKAPHIQLKVCGYEHDVPQMEGMYGFLRERIDQLPNCEHIGALAKKDLYKFMCEEADVWCYPTQFEEVSCITAMEAMAAGLTIMTTNIGALPETIGDYQNATIFNWDDGPDLSKFVDRLCSFNNKFRRRPQRNHSWSRTTDEIEDIINDENLKLGTQTGTTNHETASSYLPAERISAFGTFPFTVQALIASDIDAVIIDEIAGQGYIGKNAEALKLVGDSLSSDQLGFIFPLGSELVEPVNAALQAMIDSGFLAEINTEYFGPGFTITYDDL